MQEIDMESTQKRVDEISTKYRRIRIRSSYKWALPFYRLQKLATEREMQLFDRIVILVGAEGIVILFHG